MLIRFSVVLVLSMHCYSVMGATLCKPDEIVYFSCKIKSSSKIASLCGSPLREFSTDSLLQDGWLQYRFGKPNGKPEFIYPAVKRDSIRNFKGEIHSYLGEGNIRGYNDRIWFANRK